MPDKQRALGQFETPTDVADLLLGFCLRRPSDRLLDPGCGAGALLGRAAQWQRWQADSPADVPPDALWGVELDETTAVLARAHLPQATILQTNFFALEPPQETTPPSAPPRLDNSVLPTFDAIIGNPPYTRAEWIGQTPGETAHQLELFEDGAPADQSAVEAKRLLLPQRLWESLGGRAGLHAYFLLHSAPFLREGGRLAFVMPNGWLDVAYGERLKQFLLEHFKLLVIIESGVERWFGQAKVNTCMIVLEKCSGPNRRAANLVRLARLERPLSHFLPYPAQDARRMEAVERLITRLLPGDSRQLPEAAIRVLPQSSLRPADKWGLALRAPQVYQQRRAGPELVPLRHWATVQRGYTTGANSFFYLDPKTVERWGIEPEFRRPLLKSLRGLTRLRLTAADCRHEVLTIPPTAVLRGTAVTHYLAWAEEQGLPQNRTCAARQPWYSLPPQSPASLVLPKGVWLRHMAPLLGEDLLADQQLYRVSLAEGVPLLAAAALLNSAWFALQGELHGRLNFGAGVLWLATYELGQILLPDPRSLPDSQLAALVEGFSAWAERPLTTTLDDLAAPERMGLETAVFDALHFTQAERQETLDALRQRLNTRRQLTIAN